MANNERNCPISVAHVFDTSIEAAAAECPKGADYWLSCGLISAKTLVKRETHRADEQDSRQRKQTRLQEKRSIGVAHVFDTNIEAAAAECPKGADYWLSCGLISAKTLVKREPHRADEQDSKMSRQRNKTSRKASNRCSSRFRHQY